MTTIAVISDTHIPSRAAELPKWVTEEIESADIVVHAGDFDSEATYEAIDDLSTHLVAVRGNTDPDLGLPEVAHFEADGVAFVVTHGSGPLAGYHDRVRQTVRSTDPRAIGISGHTHELARVKIGGTRLFNPGSATGAGPASKETMLRVHVADGDPTVEELEES